MSNGHSVRTVSATVPNGFDPIIHRLKAAHPLSPSAITLIREAPTRQVARHADIFAEGDARGDRLFLKWGWACRYRLLNDGRKQIINFHIPGDLIGPYTPTAKCFAAAVTDTVLSRVPRVAIASTADRALSLPAAIDALLAADFEMMVERTVSLGRRNAKERMAHLILELHERLSRVGLVHNRSFAMPVTQEMIGDALGLSMVHVNRTVRALREQGLATIGYGRATVHSLSGLIAVAGAEDGFHVPLEEATSLVSARSYR